MFSRETDERTKLIELFAERSYSLVDIRENNFTFEYGKRMFYFLSERRNYGFYNTWIRSLCRKDESTAFIILGLELSVSTQHLL